MKTHLYGMTELAVVNGVRKVLKAYKSMTRDERDRLIIEIKARGNILVWWPE